MRPSIFACILAAPFLVAGAGQGRAQSPYNYAWCGVYPPHGVRSCYLSSYEQCMARMRTARGYCTRNLAYRGPAPGGVEPHRKR
jgi:hypothetical protein